MTEMQARFLKNFDWTVPNTGGRVTRAYKAGNTYVISQACHDAAAAVAAVEPASSVTKATEPADGHKPRARRR